mgnify:CR=1 FL=1
MLRKRINKTIEDISKRKLSIQFSLDGFSFCATNHKNEIYCFSSYQFENEVNSPELILDHIKEIFNKDKVLQDDFESVSVIHQNSLNAFVPNVYFNEKELKNYLKFSVKTIATDLIVYDDLESYDYKNVYIPYVNINNFLFQSFGQFEYKHHGSILIEKLLLYSSSEDRFFVNINLNTINIVFIEDKKLVFYNSFDVETKEDFIYYILFVLEQLMLNPEEIKLTLLGEIEVDSDFYETAYTYIRNVSFLETDNEFLNTADEISKHSNFILLG